MALCYEGHIGVDADAGLMHTVIGKAANVADVTQAQALLHGQQTDAWGDAGYRGVNKSPECHSSAVRWEVALRPGQRGRLDHTSEIDRLLEKAEKLKASIRPRSSIRLEWSSSSSATPRCDYQGLARNTARLTMLFALGNLGMVRARLREMRG